MTTTEIIDSLEKELAQLQINLQAHIQIKQVLNAMRGDLDNSKNGNKRPKKSSPKVTEQKDE